jgi:antitoxin ParD1/3/4
MTCKPYPLPGESVLRICVCRDALSQFDTRPSRKYNLGMLARSTLNVSLTPELEEFVRHRVDTGRYQTASEVVREGLRLLELQERDRDAAHAALKVKLNRAAAQADVGLLANGEEFIDKLIGRLRNGSNNPHAQ